MKEIPLNAIRPWKNKVSAVAIVDDEDYEKVAAHNWTLREAGAKYRRIRYAVAGKPQVGMHRLIIGAKKGEVVDHINGDGLDNRKANLRICTTKENIRNRQRSTNNTSGYKGVSWAKLTSKWFVSIQVDGKSKYVGIYADIKDAVEAYKQAAIKHFGEFARYDEYRYTEDKP